VDFISRIIDFILHVDVYLEQLITNYGVWTLAILFAVIFMERVWW
jgi:membrane-associated protein